MPLRPSSATDWPSATASEMSESTTASPYPAVNPSIRRRSDIERLAQVDGLDPAITRDRVGCPLDEQRAVDQDRNAVGKAEHEIHVVLDEHHGHVLGQAR